MICTYMKLRQNMDKDIFLQSKKNYIIVQANKQPNTYKEHANYRHRFTG